MTNDCESVEFCWKQHFQGLAIMAIDTILGIGALLVIGWLIRFTSAQNITRLIIHYASWPATVIILAFMFRTILQRALNEVPSFIGRSSYGGERTDLIKVATDFEVKCKNVDEYNYVGDCAGEELVEDSEILISLQRKYVKPIMRDIKLAGTDYVFDGIMEGENTIVGIEIMTYATIEALNHRVWAIAKAYDNFPKKLKTAFSLLVLLVGIDEESKGGLDVEIIRLCEHLPFAMKVDYWESNVENVKEPK